MLLETGWSVNMAGTGRRRKVLHKPCVQESWKDSTVNTGTTAMEGRWRRGALGLSHKQTPLHRDQ